MERHAWLDGSLLPLADAKIGVYDLALLRGFGIYEGIAAHDGEPFHFHDHWERFGRSAKRLDLRLPISESEALEATQSVVAENAPEGRAIVRMILTGGDADGGVVHVQGREKLYILAEPMVPYPPEWYERGAKMITHMHKRALPEYKTIDYTVAVMLQPQLKGSQAAEAVYVSDGAVLECTGSNVFIVKEGTLATPKDDVLHGITRKVTLEIAKEADLTVEERAVSLEELLAADEVFITSSFKDIVPVVSVDDKTIGTGTPGQITKDLMKRFAAYIESV